MLAIGVVLAIAGAVVAAFAMSDDDSSAGDARADEGIDRSASTTTSTTTIPTTTTTISPDGPWQTASGPAGRFTVDLPPDWKYVPVEGEVTGGGEDLFPDESVAGALLDTMAAGVEPTQPQLLALKYPVPPGDADEFLVVDGQSGTGTPNAAALAAATKQAYMKQTTENPTYHDTPREILAEGHVEGPTGSVPYLESTLPRLPGYVATTYFVVNGDWAYIVTHATSDPDGRRANADRIAASFAPV